MKDLAKIQPLRHKGTKKEIPRLSGSGFNVPGLKNPDKLVSMESYLYLDINPFHSLGA